MEQIGGERHIGGPGNAERLAVVQRFQLGQLLEMLEDQISDPPDDPAPLGGRHAPPRTVIEGGAGGPHRPVDVLGAS